MSKITTTSVALFVALLLAAYMLLCLARIVTEPPKQARMIMCVCFSLASGELLRKQLSRPR